MLAHGGQYRTEDKLKIQTLQKLNKTQKKQTMHNTAKKNTPVQSPPTTFGQETR